MPLSVTVGDGNEFSCSSVCKNVPVVIQSQIFHVDLFAMSIVGANLIFGVEWLKTLSPIVTDYSLLTMGFMKDSKLIELKGCSSSGPTKLNHIQVHCLVSTNKVIAYFHLQVTLTDSHSALPPTTDSLPSFQVFLTKYPSLFQSSTTIPSSCPTDHAIHLLPDSASMNVFPYQYPSFQK